MALGHRIAEQSYVLGLQQRVTMEEQKNKYIFFLLLYPQYTAQISKVTPTQSQTHILLECTIKYMKPKTFSESLSKEPGGQLIDMQMALFPFQLFFKTVPWSQKVKVSGEP